MMLSVSGFRLPVGSFENIGQLVSIPETGFEALKLAFPRVSTALKHTIFPLSDSSERVTEFPAVYVRVSSQGVPAGTTVYPVIFPSVAVAEMVLFCAGVVSGLFTVMSGQVVSIFVTL